MDLTITIIASVSEMLFEYIVTLNRIIRERINLYKTQDKTQVLMYGYYTTYIKTENFVFYEHYKFEILKSINKWYI